MSGVVQQLEHMPNGDRGRRQQVMGGNGHPYGRVVHIFQRLYENLFVVVTVYRKHNPGLE